MTIRLRRALISGCAVAVVAAVGFGAPAALASADDNNSTVDVQLLAINDFHGNLEPPVGSSGSVNTLDPTTGSIVKATAGGVGYLATHLEQARVGHPNSLTLGVGDLIGASPLLSAAFHDEPTILAMNTLGMDVAVVGNHEFDEGKDELLRMAYGGCRTDDGCYDPTTPFPGAAFPYLAGNVIDDATGQPLLPPYWIKNFNGARIGFIGLTLKDTPNIVTKAGVAGLTFTDEVQTANSYVPVLRALGVRAIVLMLHQGGNPASSVYDYNCDAGGPGTGLAGDVVNIAQRVDPQIDLIVTGHTHNSYVCDIPDPAGQPRLVTSAASFGRLYTDIELRYDKTRQDIVRSSVKAHNVIVSRDVTMDADESALLSKYGTLIAPIQNRVVGRITADITRAGRESALGDVIADAQLAATRPPDKGGAVIALMNPGGIRAELTYASSTAGEGAGVVTYGEAFTVQPFNNLLVTLTLTGKQLVTVLQQQYSGTNVNSPKVLQVSKGLTYTVDPSRTGADRVLADTIKINDVALDPVASYRVTTNNFLSGGGDGFGGFTAGTDVLNGGLDIDAFVAYLTESSSVTPLAPPAADRITFLG